MNYDKVILLIALASFGKDGAFGRELYERHCALHANGTIGPSYPGQGAASGLHNLEHIDGAPIHWNGWKYVLLKDATLYEGELS